MALGVAALCFLLAVVTLSKAQDGASGALTLDTNFSYQKQQLIRSVFEKVHRQFPANKRCDQWASAFAKKLGIRDDKKVDCGCARIPGPPTTKGIYYFSKGFRYINLYVAKDNTNWILAAPAAWN